MTTVPAWPDDPATPLDDEEARRLHAWWRAANYLSVGQIYLLDNPLLRRPLSRDSRIASLNRALPSNITWFSTAFF